MRILKPLRIECMTRILPAPSRHHIVVTGQLCGDLLTHEILFTDQKLCVSAEFLGSDKVLDHWVPKLCGKFQACGNAVAPIAIPVSPMNVSVSVGALRKQVCVSGNRYWCPRLIRIHITEAPRILEMPITYERAFGGEGYAGNPVGVGYRAQPAVEYGANVQLPNLQSPTCQNVHQRDESTPCALGPVDLAWPEKHSSSGTFDKAWFKQLYPLSPSNFEFRVYNVAPADRQHGSGFFAGDEAVYVDGMHGSEHKIRSHLPRLTMRLFVVKMEVKNLFEIPTRLHTMWLFPSTLTRVILYRAVMDCDDADSRDIDAILLTCERLGQSKPLTHYEEDCGLRTEDATKALHHLVDEHLMPELWPETERELDAKRHEVRRKPREKWQAEGDHFKATAGALTGLALPSAASGYMLLGNGAWLEVRLPIVLPEDIARGSVDIDGIQGAADAPQQRGRDMRATASQLVPLALREEMGFSKAKETLRATQAPPERKAFWKSGVGLRHSTGVPASGVQDAVLTSLESWHCARENLDLNQRAMGKWSSAGVGWASNKRVDFAGEYLRDFSTCVLGGSDCLQWDDPL